MMAWSGICAEDMVALNLEAEHKTVDNLECEVVEMQDQPYGLRVLGKIVNVIADEEVLDDAGKIDAGKIKAFAFDQMQNGYYAIGEKVGQAWNSGADLMKK